MISVRYLYPLPGGIPRRFDLKRVFCFLISNGSVVRSLDHLVAICLIRPSIPKFWCQDLLWSAARSSLWLANVWQLRPNESNKRLKRLVRPSLEISVSYTAVTTKRSLQWLYWRYTQQEIWLLSLLAAACIFFRKGELAVETYACVDIKNELHQCNSGKRLITTSSISASD